MGLSSKKCVRYGVSWVRISKHIPPRGYVASIVVSTRCAPRDIAHTSLYVPHLRRRRGPVRASVDWLLDSACFGWLPCWPEPPEVLPELPGAAGCSLGLSPGVDGPVGLIVTIGIGSSFSTLPIITVIYVPLCMPLGFNPAATVAIVGTAGALGDAGSAASDSTLGPTIGLGRVVSTTTSATPSFRPSCTLIFRCSSPGG